MRIVRNPFESLHLGRIQAKRLFPRSYIEWKLILCGRQWTNPTLVLHAGGVVGEVEIENQLLSMHTKIGPLDPVD